MCRWFGNELTAVELAIRVPECEFLPILAIIVPDNVVDSQFHHILQQRRDTVLQLQIQWANPLASAARYAARAENAVRVAAQLTGDTTGIQLRWLQPVTCEISHAPDAEQDAEDHGLEPLGDYERDVVPPEEVLFGDVLEGGDSEDEEDHHASTPTVNFQWKVPEARFSNITVDLLDLTPEMTIATGPISDLVQPPSERLGHLQFAPKDVDILGSPGARLNDTCLNGCAALLHQKFCPSEPSPFALFSTHDLPHVRYHADDDELWRHMSRTRYWEKRVWILPIHRPSSWGHWVLCSIHLDEQHIVLFDSLAEPSPWKRDLPVIMDFLSRLSTIAVSRLRIKVDVDVEWTAISATCAPIQTNAVDCGLWVLAQMVAAFRGQGITGMKEEGMSTFRRYLQSLVLHSNLL
ncbi:hypothetical protein JVU11DRAFT_3001 [Chiua virens]|nr:hypothetical protein JVU11DRAFT_3001 [Chiua virens]